MPEIVPRNLLGEFRQALVELTKSDIYKDIIEPRDSVFERYQAVFCTGHAEEITEEEFRSFLVFDNNRHWTGLHRQGPRMCADMGTLRTALSTLADAALPVEDRLNHAVGSVSGMGKNVATAILTVIEPEKYGVWNNRSEGSLKRYRIWPEFERGEGFGSRYLKVNEVLVQLRDALDTDLWTLDALWWYLDRERGREQDVPASGSASNGDQSFGLERHLHDFIRDNWARLELGKDWDIYSEPGDDEAGYEYPCDVGRIDLLAKHKTESKWLVIELKRDQTSDQTVGQLLRYVGWVKAKLADPGDQVRGLIICREADESLKYALSMVPEVDLQHYEVEFHLRPVRSQT